jgi:hypothetical protein
VIPIPGIVIAILTFPGVIMHEVGHLFFCKMRKVAVFDVCFFRSGNPAGYVVHERTEDFTTLFFIDMGPFIVNSVLCVVFCFPALIPLRIFGHEDPLSYFWIWLGVSIGMHAFPSTQDARNLWEGARKAAKTGSVLALISFPLVVLLYAANFLRFFWVDTLYGLAIGLGLPELILRKVI